jgi:hypothetical protein
MRDDVAVINAKYLSLALATKRAFNIPIFLYGPTLKVVIQQHPTIDFPGGGGGTRVHI